MISPGKSIEGTRAEVRCPDPSSNTYLAFAAMIAAGLDGVERGLDARSDRSRRACSRSMRPASRRRASASCPGRSARRSTSSKRDPVVADALGDHVLSPLRRRQARRVGRVPAPGHRLGAGPLPRGLLTHDSTDTTSRPRPPTDSPASPRAGREPMTARTTAIADDRDPAASRDPGLPGTTPAPTSTASTCSARRRSASTSRSRSSRSCAGPSRATSRSTRRSSTPSRTR